MGRGDSPPGHTGLPRPGAVVWVVWGCVTGIRWAQGRPLTTEAHPVPELGRLLLAALVAAVLLAAEAAAISSLDKEKRNQYQEIRFKSSIKTYLKLVACSLAVQLLVEFLNFSFLVNWFNVYHFDLLYE